MKNYEEMTENVFRRRDAYAARQKRNRLTAASALAVAACLIGAVIPRWLKSAPNTPLEVTLPSQTMVQTQPSTAPTQQDPPVTESHLTVLAYTTNVTEARLEENIALPLAYYIGVTDIRDLGTEEEVKALMDQQSDAMEQYLLQLVGNDDLRGICHRRVLRRKSFVISFLRCGSFQLHWEQVDDIESVNVKTATGYGEVTVHQGNFDSSRSYSRGFDVTVDAETLSDSPLLIDWSYSGKLLEKLEADPTVPLADFSDTITVTATSRDGTVQSCEIDIIINADGSVWALLHDCQIRL